jgi:flagellar hook assembly protein FlgD
VEIGIYDIAGRMVARVTSGSLPEGQHELVWDGTSNGAPVPVGLYVARITTPGGPTAVERIVIAR